MTEANDAAAAPMPPSGGSPSGPVAPDPSFGGAVSVPGVAGPGASFAGVAMTAPVPAGSGDLATASTGGTGWPGDVPGAPPGGPPGGARGRPRVAGQSPGVQSPGVQSPDARSPDARSPGVRSPDARPPASAPSAAGSAEPRAAASAKRKPAPRSVWTPATEAGPAASDRAETDADDEPFARVDARKLEAALLGLRHPIVTVPLLFEAPGVTQARAERVKLLSQIDDYMLPRLRQSGAPILVALVGSTGAGKSTLMNSVVAKQVSATGIRRPTTNSPVLACHPDDMRWFAENVFLPTLPRVRQQGLAMPGRDGLLVLAASEGMPKGVAVLDTPDIDSVVQAHRDFADQFLDASDLWLFVTTARRYADAAVWEMLQDARARGAALAIALSRVPPPAAAELSAHFDAMLEANGLREVRRFIIPETVITDAQLPAQVAAPVRDWLADTARREDRRVAVLTQTMSGMLDTFRARVPALADQVTAQIAARSQLRETVGSAFEAGLAEFEQATRDGSLLNGEVLARWQDFAGTGDLLRTLQARRGRGGSKQRKQQLPARAVALAGALQASLVSLITATADRAAELVVADWQRQPAGRGLLAEHGPTDRRRDGGSAELTEADFVASALADLGLVSGTGAEGRDNDQAALARATAGLAGAAAATVSAWQEHVRQLVTQENVTKRSIARVVTFDTESLALVLTIGALRSVPSPGSVGAGSSLPDGGVPDGGVPDGGVPDGGVPDGTLTVGTAIPRLLESLFGAGLLRDLGARVRLDLRERVDQLFGAEAERFFAIIDSAGELDENAAGELLQAGHALEGAR